MLCSISMEVPANDGKDTVWCEKDGV